MSRCRVVTSVWAFLFALTACGRGEGVGISSLEVAGLDRWEWMAARYRRVQVAVWERLGPKESGWMKEEKQARLE